MSQRAQRMIEAARKLPVPEGTYAVGLGLIISGITAYGFQILAFRGLSKTDYAALNGLWILLFIVAPGFFLPLEQEVGRAVAHRRANGEGGGPVIRKAAWASAALTGGLVVFTLVWAFDLPARRAAVPRPDGAARVLPHRARDVRGPVPGEGRVLRQRALRPLRHDPRERGHHPDDPADRARRARDRQPALVRARARGAAHPRGADLLARPARAHATRARDAEWSELSTNLTYLLLGSLTAQALSYSAALGGIVLAQGPAERKMVADFIVGFFIARIPILLFQAVQAALLPKLAGLAGAGRIDDFRSGLRKLVLIVIGVGVLGVVGGVTVGPTVGKILFGNQFNLEWVDLGLLCAGSAFFILALTLAQALIALHGHARAFVAWLSGLVVAILVTAFSTHELFRRIEYGFLAGCGIAALDDGGAARDPHELGNAREPRTARRADRNRTTRDLARCARSSPARAGSSAATSWRTSKPRATPSSGSTATGPSPPTSPTRDAVRQRVVDAQPDAVYHLAALTHVGESWDQRDAVATVNVDGTRHVVDACAGTNVRAVVVVGSAEQYGAVDDDDLPIGETTAQRPLSPYAESKVAAEASRAARVGGASRPGAPRARVQPHRTRSVTALPRPRARGAHRRRGRKRHRRDRRRAISIRCAT